jgi:hypothetical protein
MSEKIINIQTNPGDPKPVVFGNSAGEPFDPQPRVEVAPTSEKTWVGFFVLVNKEVPDKPLFLKTGPIKGPHLTTTDFGLARGIHSVEIGHQLRSEMKDPSKWKLEKCFIDLNTMARNRAE